LCLRHIIVDFIITLVPCLYDAPYTDKAPFTALTHEADAVQMPLSPVAQKTLIAHNTDCTSFAIYTDHTYNTVKT
jgi:hypothetical protein